MVLVREMTADDWELMRDIRLTALRDAPSAFASTYAQEAAYTADGWRGWFSDRVSLFLADLGPDSGSGIDPEHRWGVLRERMLAMREIWTQDEAQYHGEYVDFDPIWSWPKPVRRPPVLLG